jgi:hypothetical protein
MATSLYDLSVPTFLQTAKAIGGFLDLAVRHCADSRTDPDDFVLAPGSIRRAAGHDRQGGNGAGVVHPRRGQ